MSSYRYDVSIIIPAYCRSFVAVDWFRECLLSAVSQDCEVVVWDDGSPEYLGHVKREFEGQVEWYGSRKNHGVSYARNRAVEHATKSLIIPLDCDDRFAPDTIKQMVGLWVQHNGKAIYTDVKMFGDKIAPHYEIFDFTCKNVRRYVGFTSVAVLHTKAQWRSIGGWDEEIEFYEDGEYNGRLFTDYCAVRLPRPLLEYRFHNNQRTVQYNDRAGEFGSAVLDKLRRREGMCCGSKRRQGNPNLEIYQDQISNGGNMLPDRSEAVKIVYGENELSMPLEFEGKFLAKYIGGEGKGKHTYKGRGSNQAFQRIKFGDLVYAKRSDIMDPAGQDSKSLLVLVSVAGQETGREVRKVEPPTMFKPEEIVEQPAAEEVKEPRVAPERTPVDDDEYEEEFDDDEEFLPEITNMSLKRIRRLKLDPEEASELLIEERGNKKRKSVIGYLEGIANA